MIRVLQVIEGLEIGGAETMIVNLHRAIDRDKVQFDYIITNPSKSQAYFKEVRELGGRVFVFPAFNGKNIVQVRNHWKNFFQRHREYKILHSHLRSYASIFLPIARKYGLKTIIHSHSTSNGSGISAIVKAILQYPLRWQADCFMGCSNEAGEWLFGRRICKTERFIVLKNAIESTKFSYNESVRKMVRQELQLEDSITYIHVGRFHKAKNHVFLLKIFKKIVEINADCKLILVGDGELKGEICALIHELNLDKSVLLLGNKLDVQNYLQAADCFLFPSLWEGLGMSVIEAQAAGLKCICSTAVPNEVDITGLCKFIPLQNISEWIKSALSIKYKRTDTTQMIKKSGYDITQSSQMLEYLYKNLYTKAD